MVGFEQVKFELGYIQGVLSIQIKGGDQAIFKFQIFRTVIAVTWSFLDQFGQIKYQNSPWDEF